MFVREHQNQFRNANADVEIFYQPGTWLKPPGAAIVYMLLIGGGASGTASSRGGSSGNVVTWLGPAQSVPDSLIVSPGQAVTTAATSGNSSTISYGGSSLITLLTASGGNSAGANIGNTANAFAASGFFNSSTGQTGATTGNITAATGTFLSGGIGPGGTTITANYGYTAPSTAIGFFQIMPILVGISSGTSSTTQAGPIGCGGSHLSSTAGPGMILIASW